MKARTVGVGWFSLFLFIMLACVQTGLATTPEKLIALSIDDGPKPFVLYGWREGTKEIGSAHGLLSVLDKYRIPATFFPIGWKLDPGCKEPACEGAIEALKDVVGRGHKFGSQPNSHAPMLKMLKEHGLEWVMGDVELGARRIEAVTGERPIYFRPPQGSINKDLYNRLVASGWTVATKTRPRGVKLHPLFIDVDTGSSGFYADKGKYRPHCFNRNKEYLANLLDDCLYDKIAAREKLGYFNHILVVHEFPLVVRALDIAIPELKKRGYRFVTLDEYFAFVRPLTEKKIRR